MLKIAVLLKYCRGEINPFDKTALECALRTKDAEVIAITMSPLSVRDNFCAITRLGVKRAILISDKLYAGSDTLATSKILSKALKMIMPDIVLCGRQSIDGDTAQIPAEVSEYLGYNFIPYAMEFQKGKVNTRLGEREIIPPCVVSVEKFLELRLPSIFSKIKEIEVWDNSVLNLSESEVGTKGSPTKVLKVFENNQSKRKCEFVLPNNLSEIIYKALNKPNVAEKEIISSNKLPVIFVSDEALRKKAEHLAKEVVLLSGKTAEQLSEEIIKQNAKVVLFTASLNNRVVAPKLAAKLNCGLCADCIGLETDGQNLFMYRPASSGDIVAKIGCESKITMATVRINQDASQGVVFGVGYGAKAALSAIGSLAEKYNAELAASRKLIDNSKLPYEMQVGLTGRIISPKVYVAFGISGAVQHIVGIERSQTVIAINSDKNAEIFKYADYGIIKEIETICW